MNSVLAVAAIVGFIVLIALLDKRSNKLRK